VNIAKVKVTLFSAQLSRSERRHVLQQQQQQPTKHRKTKLILQQPKATHKFHILPIKKGEKVALAFLCVALRP